MLKKTILSVVFLGLLLMQVSCSQHQKLLKSTDHPAKYEAAMKYYDRGDFYRALQLFDQLIPVYRGTPQSEELFFRYAYAYLKQRDFIMASYHFSRFVAMFPMSRYAEEAFYMAAYCKYLESPRYSLDQTPTRDAINEFQAFINRYPQSERVKEATRIIDELRFKLQKKDFEIANTYMRIEDYQAAIVSYRNLLKDFPDTEFREEAMYRIVVSAYQFARRSIPEKIEERLQEADAAYFEFIALFPESRYSSELRRLHQRLATERTPKKSLK